MLREEARIESLVPVKSRILGREEEAPDTVTFKFDKPFPKAAPGQFIMVSTADGEVPISLAEEDAITFKRVGRATGRLFGLGVGDFMGVRGPYGNAWPGDYDEYLIVAGGIGIPPIRFFMKRHRGKSITLLYGARTPLDIVYKRQLMEEWPRVANVMVTVDKADGEWRGNVGLVTSLLDKVGQPKGAALLIGPEVMMMYAAKKLMEMGVSEDRIYLSLERHMECGVGFCGHCNLGRHYVCIDGPIFKLSAVKAELAREGWKI